MSYAAFQRVLAHFAGNQSEMARAIGTSQQRVSYIAKNRNPLPPELVIAAERATGIPRYEIRPDVYPCETPAATSAGIAA